MDDRHAQFLILLEAVFAGAELADLRIELQTIKGTRIGVCPEPRCWLEIDLTSYNDRAVRIGTVEVAFQDVVSFTVASPGASDPIGRRKKNERRLGRLRQPLRTKRHFAPA